MINLEELFDKIDLNQDRPALRREVISIAKFYKFSIKFVWKEFTQYRSKKLGK